MFKEEIAIVRLAGLTVGIPVTSTLPERYDTLYLNESSTELSKFHSQKVTLN